MGEIRLDIDGAVARFTIDHPERLNALSPEMLAQFSDGLDQVAETAAVRAVVITGAGTKAFASGGDISRFDETRKDYDSARKSGERLAGVFAKFQALPKPTIAMIRGYCFGGGLALALQADMRFAAEGALFSIPAARLGIAYGPGATRQLMQLCGPSHTRDILYSARRFGAEEAARIGLINRVLPVEALEPYVTSYCETLVANAPISQAATKLFVGEMLKPPGRRDTDAMEAIQKTAAESADFKEGRRAFMEKRKPEFRGE